MSAVSALCATCAALLAMTAVVSAAPSGLGSADEFLAGGLGAADFVVSSAVRPPSGVGLMWNASLVGQGEPEIKYSRVADLYSGASGVVLFLLEAHFAASAAATAPGAAASAAVNATKYLATARAAGDFLLDDLPGRLDSLNNTSLYHGGSAGIGFALQSLYEATGDASFQRGAHQVVAWIRAHPVGEDDCAPLFGVRWGGAGTGFFLLHMHRATHDPSLLASAQAEGRRLLACGERAHGGLTWPWSPSVHLFMPNYAEGAAGIGYYLATLAHLTRHNGTAAAGQPFLDGALAAARYLTSVADTTDGGCLVFHSNTHPTMFYLAECNGPAGTGRLWQRLGAVTGDPAWMVRWAEGSAKSLRDHGRQGDHFNWVIHKPQVGEEPWWQNVGQCDGSAGVSEFCLLMWRHTSGSAQMGAHRDFALDVARDILHRRATEAPGGGLMWTTEEWRTDPAHSTGPQVGYMQGAAGIGSLFLRISATLSGRATRVFLPPDHPEALGFA